MVAAFLFFFVVVVLVVVDVVLVLDLDRPLEGLGVLVTPAGVLGFPFVVFVDVFALPLPAVAVAPRWFLILVAALAAPFLAASFCSRLGWGSRSVGVYLVGGLGLRLASFGARKGVKDFLGRWPRLRPVLAEGALAFAFALVADGR